MSNTKQVIVMRTDLNMRKGKMIAQGSHASMAFLSQLTVRMLDSGLHPDDLLLPVEIEWLESNFTKICVRVNSLDELLAVADDAETAGIVTRLITDSGLTEFHGVPTRTCLALGPDYAEKIDPITGHLKLL